MVGRSVHRFLRTWLGLLVIVYAHCCYIKTYAVLLFPHYGCLLLYITLLSSPALFSPTLSLPASSLLPLLFSPSLLSPFIIIFMSIFSAPSPVIILTMRNCHM